MLPSVKAAYCTVMYVRIYVHSVNTNTEVSKNFPNTTEKRYYVQTLASKITLNGSTQQQVNLPFIKNSF